MSSRCLDCSYKAGKKFPGGNCPACGSFNIKTSGSIEKVSWEPEKRQRTFLETVLMLQLWAIIIYGAWDRYIRHWFS
jgi:hypothetical protein